MEPPGGGGPGPPRRRRRRPTSNRMSCRRSESSSRMSGSSSTTRIRLRGLVMIVLSASRCSSMRGCASIRRQGEHETAATSHLALHPDASAVKLDEALGDGQAETRPLGLCLSVSAHLVELVEDGVELLGGNPLTRILDG